MLYSLEVTYLLQCSGEIDYRIGGEISVVFYVVKNWEVIIWLKNIKFVSVIIIRNKKSEGLNYEFSKGYFLTLENRFDCPRV